MGSPIQIALIRRDGGTQPRKAMIDAVLDDYTEQMRANADFPAVTLFHDGSNYWLADGFHRVCSAERAGRTHISSDIHQGTQRDAILYSVGANHKHGARRTSEDKRSAVMRLLDDAEWSVWPNREIARRCVVSLDLVNRLRTPASERSFRPDPNNLVSAPSGRMQPDDVPAAAKAKAAEIAATGDTPRFFRRNGAVSVMNTTAINRSRKKLTAVAQTVVARQQDEAAAQGVVWSAEAAEQGLRQALTDEVGLPTEKQRPIPPSGPDETDFYGHVRELHEGGFHADVLAQEADNYTIEAARGAHRLITSFLNHVDARDAKAA